MSSLIGVQRLLLLLGLVLLTSCSDDPASQTLLRFTSSFALNVPAGAMLHIVAHRDGERQHEPGHDLGTFPYAEDIKVTMNATGNDGSRRFTAFAELLDADGNRLSWARVRSGFVQGEISELRIELANGCANPSDQASQPEDYDPSFVCGSHDSCVVAPGDGNGICSTACYTPEPYSEVLSDISSVPVPCPERDSLLVERLEMGWDYSCALSDSEAFCWGHIANETRPEFWQRPTRIMNPDGRTTLGEGDQIRDLRASIHVACAVTMDGELRCGGNNKPNPIMHVSAGVPIEGDEPCCTVVAPGLPPVVAVEAHNYYACATAEDGDVFCSGRVPGTNGMEDYNTFMPLEVSGELVRGLRTMDGGPFYIAGFTDDGFEWFAASGFIDTTTPMPAEEDVVDISSHTDGLCMVTRDGTLQCWGRDVFEESFAAQPETYEGSWKRIAMAELITTDTEDRSHRCAVAMDGSLWCWGDAANGKLGLRVGELRTFAERLQVGSATDWVDVDTGRQHTCGIREGGHVYCWGLNDGFQLGVEGEPRGLVRVPVPGW